ncbi:MAG TPA: hypothetical protein VFC78_25125 [Tepidisphaeraceae bacterium]|nr:hypothetical protein [Tepidisphaeraceae bacterium]
MDMNRLRELRLAQPFRQFYVIVADGTRLFVDQPHHLGMSPDGSRVGVVTAKGVQLLKPEQVRDVDVCPAPIQRH